LSKDTTSELAGLSSHYIFYMLNIKQRSCDYQLLKSFGMTWPGNRTLAIDSARESNPGIPITKQGIKPWFTDFKQIPLFIQHADILYQQL